MSKLHFHHGTMGSMKSANLLSTAYKFKENYKIVRLIKPGIDTRTNGTIKSRLIEEEQECEVYDSLKIEYFTKNKPDVVLSDESQFWKKEDIAVLATLADKYNILVMCYGLMVSYNGHLFSGSQALLEQGATLHELRSSCQEKGCMSSAKHHLLFVNEKIVKDGPEVIVGDFDNDHYKLMAVCRQHRNMYFERGY